MSVIVQMGPVAVEPLEWWCDRCKYGTVFEPGNEAICRMHAEMHANTHGIHHREHVVTDRENGNER